uniref:C2H2-type domain-containing protein n=1 Tax=Timema cristinae TaxID=61476 RepID=A0A7R9CY66_TIMCR|nr:unnamed protein product [Timema cristinae]
MTTINILKAHEKILFDRHNHFSCNICGKCVRTKRSLRSHIHLHFPTNEFGCDFCGKLFSTEHQLIYTTKYSLAKHKIQHQPGGLPKEHLCEICGYLSDNLKDLKSHISSVHLHLKKLYICDICGCGYRNSHKFTSHMATHSEDKRCICALCDRCFKRRDDVKLLLQEFTPKQWGCKKKNYTVPIVEKFTLLMRC